MAASAARGGVNAGEGDILPALVSEVAQYAGTLQRPAIIGHSVGAVVALEVAAEHPDIVRRLLIVGALPFYSLTISPAASVEMMRPMAAALRTEMLAQGDKGQSGGPNAHADRAERHAKSR